MYPYGLQQFETPSWFMYDIFIGFESQLALSSFNIIIFWIKLNHEYSEHLGIIQTEQWIVHYASMLKALINHNLTRAYKQQFEKHHFSFLQNILSNDMSSNMCHTLSNHGAICTGSSPTKTG